MLGLAIAITAEAFKNVKDKGGNPYILHCLRVMDGVKELGEDVMCAAIMHDLIEDTKYSYSDLVKLGFNQKVCFILSFLTHDLGVNTYDEYIKTISNNKEATAIKLADLRDNSDITRMKGLRKKDLDRIEKYHRAYTYLKN
jgi:(p)ppGpp synthase/HD superfamily hydrolase